VRIIFLGSPEIALPCLQALVPSGEQVLAVVSQPDRPAGRGQQLTPPPVAQYANEKKIPLLQPEKIGEIFESLQSLKPDLMVVVAYGQYIPKKILALPSGGCLNIHFSLLPQYRGAAPIHWVLINNEEKTGVTSMKVTEKMDAGPIYLQQEVPIRPEDNVTILGQRLANKGAELLLETIDGLKRGALSPYEQEESESCWAPLLKKEMGQIDWTRPAKVLASLIRGTNPWPGAYTFIDRKRFKIYSAEAVVAKGKQLPGTVLETGPKGIQVACGQGALLLREVQIEGGRPLMSEEFLKGHPLETGTQFS
ncbi:MAG: methionyl-tRNA formyltransferase, partial [bacterium]|nr:methionyl-tRNA formyltransferase [bacterium]